MDFSDKDQLKEIDQHIGRRIRHLRKTYGLSQSDFGQYLGVSFQQIQKYENGTNRCPVSRLYALCQILEVDIQYSFSGFETQNLNQKITSFKRGI